MVRLWRRAAVVVGDNNGDTIDGDVLNLNAAPAVAWVVAAVLARVGVAAAGSVGAGVGLG